MVSSATCQSWSLYGHIGVLLDLSKNFTPVAAKEFGPPTTVPHDEDTARMTATRPNGRGIFCTRFQEPSL